MNKCELKQILFDNKINTDFFSEEDFGELSTFLHEEKRTRFLSQAQDACATRQALAKQISAHAEALSVALSTLARYISKCEKSEADSLKACADLSAFVSEEEKNIRTNILVFLNKIIVFFDNDSTFSQIKKELFFAETAYKVLHTLPSDWETTKAVLMQHPPQELVANALYLIQCYEKAETLLAAQLYAAIQAAKLKNREKQANILHKTAVQLHDMSERIPFFRTEDS